MKLIQTMVSLDPNILTHHQFTRDLSALGNEKAFRLLINRTGLFHMYELTLCHCVHFEVDDDKHATD